MEIQSQVTCLLTREEEQAIHLVSNLYQKIVNTVYDGIVDFAIADSCEFKRFFLDNQDFTTIISGKVKDDE